MFLQDGKLLRDNSVKGNRNDVKGINMDKRNVGKIQIKEIRILIVVVVYSLRDGKWFAEI